MNGRQMNKSDLRSLVNALGGNLIWVALALFLLVVFAISVVRFGKVSGEQVGVLVNKLNGKLTPITQSGVTPYNGLTKDFYVLDRTIQTLIMDDKISQNLKIKTVDGSDVYVDLKAQFRIIPSMADTVITTSGPGDNFKKKWAWDYVRSICRNTLGELTTEEFYNSAKRKTKLQKSKTIINDSLRDFGIEFTDVVIPQKPQFYKEYVAMIKKKKLADQGVLEERSKALAAKQKQQTLIVQSTNVKNVAVEQFEGKMEQIIIEAKAQAEKTRKGAEAYFDKITIGAEAKLYEKQKNAEGILARKKADAKGIEALKKALEGEGGRNMVKMEYAKKLKELKVTGVPYVVEGRVEKFEHNAAPAAAPSRAVKGTQGR